MIENELIRLGKRIRKLRLSKKMTLAKLAAECDFEKILIQHIKHFIKLQKPYQFRLLS